MCGDGTVRLTFVPPASIGKRPKLYVISKGARLLYVGFTTQPMADRLRQGLTANGGHGYSGYPWRRRKQTLSLTIWYLDGANATPTNLEAIEAEVVFLYRHESGQWPEEQTEIHFHPSNNRHQQFAKRIVDALKEG